LQCCEGVREEKEEEKMKEEREEKTEEENKKRCAGKEHGTLKAGTRVQLHSLQQAAHLNGRTAHLISLDAESGRWAVELELARKGEGHVVKVMGANLLVTTSRPPTAEALQELVDTADDGCRVTIPTAKYYPSRACSGLVLTSAITLEGKSSELHFPVSVSADASGALLHLSSFSVVNAPLTVRGKNIKRAKLVRLHVSLQTPTEDDALELSSICPRYEADRILVEDCEVRGGAEGVFIDGSGVRLLNCRILGAQDRGIFANQHFVIENCTVTQCGGYGMKTRAGCELRGTRNRIQPGPWDGMFDAPFGGMAHAFDCNESEDSAYDDGQEYGDFGYMHEDEMHEMGLLAQGVNPSQ